MIRELEEEKKMDGQDVLNVDEESKEQLNQLI